MSFFIINPYLLKGKASDPRSTLAAGTVFSPATVAFSTPMPAGALIFYTLDGTAPVAVFSGGDWVPIGSTVRFTDPLRLERTPSISDYLFRVVAVKEGFKNSNIVSFSYHLVRNVPLDTTCAVAAGGAPDLFLPTCAPADLSSELGLTSDPSHANMLADAGSALVFLPDYQALSSFRMNADVSLVAGGSSTIYHGGNLGATSAATLAIDAPLTDIRLLSGLNSTYKFDEGYGVAGSTAAFNNALSPNGGDLKSLAYLKEDIYNIVSGCEAFWPMHETTGTTVADVRASDAAVGYHGVTQDVCGVWGQFEANGVNDMELRFTNNVDSAIKSIQVLVDEVGGWVWSTSDNRYYPARVKLLGGSLVNSGYMVDLGLACFNQTLVVFIDPISTGGNYLGKTYRFVVSYANGQTKQFVGKANTASTSASLTASSALSGATAAGPVTTGISTAACTLSLESDTKCAASVNMLFAGWVKFSDTSATQVLVQKASAYTLFWSSAGGGTLTFRSVYANSTSDVSISCAPGTSNWIYLACGYRSYVGGAVSPFVGYVTTGSVSVGINYSGSGAPPDGAGTLRIGAGVGEGFADLPFLGVMAEWGVWKRSSHTDVQLWLRLLGGYGPLTYPFSVGYTTSAGLVDYAIGADYARTNPLLVGDYAGYLSQSKLFTGSGYAKLAGAGAVFTTGFWVNLAKLSSITSGQNGGSANLLIVNPAATVYVQSGAYALALLVSDYLYTPVGAWSTGRDQQTGITTRYDGHTGPLEFRAELPSGTSNPQISKVSRAIPGTAFSTWHLCMLAVKNSIVYMSVDGEEWVSVTTLGAPLRESPSPFQINANINGWGLSYGISSCKICQLSVWNRKLNNSELVELYNNRSGRAFSAWTA